VAPLCVSSVRSIAAVHGRARFEGRDSASTAANVRWPLGSLGFRVGSGALMARRKPSSHDEGDQEHELLHEQGRAVSDVVLEARDRYGGGVDPRFFGARRCEPRAGGIVRSAPTHVAIRRLR
jgi:hypothetical protein